MKSNSSSTSQLCQAHLIIKKQGACNKIATRRVSDIDRNIMHLCSEHFKTFVNQNLGTHMMIGKADAMKEALGEP